MAEIKDIYRTVLDPMGVLYMPPRQIKSEAQQRQALLEYVGPLRGFTTEHLEQGWNRLKATYGRSIWPTIGEIVEAVRYCIPVPPGGIYGPARREPERHSQAADATMKTDLGRAALDAGWGISLHEFVEKNGRAPDPMEQADLIVQSEQVRLDIETWRKNPKDGAVGIYIRARSKRIERLKGIAYEAKPVENVSRENTERP